MSHPQRNPPPNTTLVCSVCGRQFLMDETTAPPFCSQRCKLVDLGRWLDEEISVPHEGGPTKGEPVGEDTECRDRF